MTVQQAKTRLFMLTPTIFPKVFRQKAEMVRVQLSKNDHAGIIEQNLVGADSCILLVAQNLSSLSNLQHLANVVNPLVAYAVYTKYYFTDKVLGTLPQDDEIDLSPESSKFLEGILIDYWPTVLSKLSKL